MVVFLISFTAVLALFAFAFAPNLKRRNGEAFLQKYYAHRGLHDEHTPENSLAAFKKARELGYGIELDVQMTKDGVAVVFHDDTLSRMCGVQGTLAEKTYRELKSLRLLETDEGIPLFKEVLDAVDGRVPLLVELKNGHSNRALVDEVLKILSGYRGAYLIESFSPIILYRVKRRAPHMLRGQLVGRVDKNLRGGRRAISIALNALLLNFLSRPDFIAYDFTMADSWQISLQRALFRAKTAEWTIRSASGLPRSRACDIAIFEKFYP